MSEFKNRNVLPGMRIPDLYSIGKIVAGVIVVALIVIVIYHFMAVKTATDAVTIDELLAEADVLVIVQPGTITVHEVPVSAQVDIGLDGRQAAVTEYLFSSGGTNGASATGFSTFLGSHTPGEVEIITALSPFGESKIILKFV